jgi:hypothetical protein
MKKSITVLAAALVGIRAGRIWTLQNENEKTTSYLFDVGCPGVNLDATRSGDFKPRIYRD